MNICEYPNFLSSDEVDEILGWLENKPYSKEKIAPATIFNASRDILHFRNKNIDFHLNESVVRQIVYPKLLTIVPGAVPTHSAFLESHYPFSLHIDTVQTFNSKNLPSTAQDSNDRAVMITLNESPDFQTVFFDLYLDDIDRCYNEIPTMVEDLPVPIYDNVSDLSHLPNKARNLLSYHCSKAQAFTWKKGMALSWSRRQLHCSSNFYNKGIKQALIMFF